MLDTEVTDATDSSFIQGAELGNSPKLSFNALASQEYELNSGGLLTVTANVAHTGDQVKVTATTGNNLVVDQMSVDAYTLLGANVSYRFGQEQQYNLSLFGRNLTDEKFCGAVLLNDGNAVLDNVTNPATAVHMNALCRVTNASTRTFGLSFGIDF